MRPSPYFAPVALVVGLSLLAPSQAYADPEVKDLECTKGFSLDGHAYDFTDLNKISTLIKLDSANSLQVQSYSLNLCEALNLKDLDVWCKDSRVCKIITDFKNGHPQISQGFSWADDVKPKILLETPGDSEENPNLIVYLKHDDGNTHVTTKITMKCPKGDAATEGVELVKSDEKALEFTLETKTACATEQKVPETQPEDDPKSEGGMSGIGIFFLIVFFGIAVYFIAGVYYNHKVYGAHGWDLIPNSEFWRELPSLISDVMRHIYDSLFRRGASGYSTMA